MAFPILQLHDAAAGVVTGNGGDCLQINNGRAVNLLEMRWVQLVEQLAQRRTHQRFAKCGHHDGVFIVGLKVGDIIDHDQPRFLAGIGRQPHQRRRVGFCGQHDIEFLDQRGEGIGIRAIDT